MKFLTACRYNIMDAAWISVGSLCFHEGQTAAGFAVALIGGVVSGALTGWTNRRHAQRHGGRNG